MDRKLLYSKWESILNVLLLLKKILLLGSVREKKKVSITKQESIDHIDD